jgi:hypothetical protein
MSDLKYMAGRRGGALAKVRGKFRGKNAEKGQKKGIKNVVLGSFREKLLCYN